MRRSIATLAVLVTFVAVATPRAWVDVHAEFDKAFDFTRIKTWAWNPRGAGDLIMARTKDDDPEAMKKRVEPILFDAVANELKGRGLTMAASSPDIVVTYYLLLSTNTSSQTVGQFLPATVAWGLPVFAPATQSLKVMNSGSLVLDLSAAETIVWRGVAQASIKIGIDAKAQERLLREGVRDLLRRYPSSR